jgi:hypothetical protein
MSIVAMQAFQVTVRNKKRVGYNYELSLRFRGKHHIISRLTSFTQDSLLWSWYYYSVTHGNAYQVNG